MSQDFLNHKLFNDYLELCDSYREEMPIYEFGFSMARVVSKMMFDTAPSARVAWETLQVGIVEGWNWSEKEKEDNK